MNNPNLLNLSNHDGFLMWCEDCEVYFSKCCHADVKVDEAFNEVVCCGCGDVL